VYFTYLKYAESDIGGYQTEKLIRQKADFKKYNPIWPKNPRWRTFSIAK
jgi:hypothetical protein